MVKKRSVNDSPARSIADWENAALDAIAAGGLRSLAIPDLARSLGVTKGSFYWHFRGIQELIDASLRRWEELDRSLLGELHVIADPADRLTALFVQAMEKRDVHALYVALAAAAAPEVTPTLRRINARRLGFLGESYEQLGLPRADAKEQALLAYTAYVGALHLRQQRSPGLTAEKDLAAYIAHAVKTLIPRVNAREKHIQRARPRVRSQE
jgi:AcrR family transcriptional regulator